MIFFLRHCSELFVKHMNFLSPVVVEDKTKSKNVAGMSQWLRGLKKRKFPKRFLRDFATWYVPCFSSSIKICMARQLFLAIAIAV